MILNGDGTLQAQNTEPPPSNPHRQPLTALARSYVVYSLCSIPAIVDYAPSLLDFIGRIPVLNHVAYSLIKITFFDQFVGGETASATVPLLRALRAANKGALFAYSAEVDEKEALSSESKSGKLKAHHKRVVDEILTCIDVAADFEDSLRGASKALSPYLHDTAYRTPTSQASIAANSDLLTGRRTWVAIKVTALLPDAHALINLSKYITSRREQMKAVSAEQSSLTSARSAPATLSAATVPRVEDIPFPGAALLSDLDIVLSPSRDDAPLSTNDIQQLRELYDDLVKICVRAEQRGVRLIVDAEYSWYQPALDALTLALMRRFNALPSSNVTTGTPPSSPRQGPVQPLIYATYQAYLRRVPLQLAHNLHDAKSNNYSLGVKLVRGAYHPYETNAHRTFKNGGKSLCISSEDLPPVWLEKHETDKAYDDCTRMVIEAVKEDVLRQRAQQYEDNKTGDIRVGVLFGTHNWDSCNLVLDELVRQGLGEVVKGEDNNNKVKVRSDVVERICIAQLYGMCDDLTDSLTSRVLSDVPMVTKYIPYGGLTEVLPYLSRRAIENKSVLGDGAAARERQRALREIMTRIRETFSLPLRRNE
ncbi:proline dehydrogenase [Coprinopsis cinerea okayama7|uniref:Proline dehydrogenase n=1 Tax=Coprinopsis cinerea (strain Okayama-7 / 130 / ATCC MYA-4618 / FGSC 9003) TaxID=240176 RepID=A8N0W7_COPC7|nr:proline dehydrogenase [Coprinopsis cinerea okayama7\|eukprot:XP_001828516.2 proline dehydrogenase [Coprinopsis cinerea okayama7\